MYGRDPFAAAWTRKVARAPRTARPATYVAPRTAGVADAHDCHCGGVCGPCQERISNLTYEAPTYEAPKPKPTTVRNAGYAQWMGPQAFAPAWSRTAGEVYATGPRDARQAERTSGYVTPSGLPCAFGASRLPNGRCPEDTDDDHGAFGSGWGQPGAGAFGSTPTAQEVERMTPEQRAQLARQTVARAGGSQADQDAAASRARDGNFDWQMFAGVLSGGMNALRDWIRGDSAERVAQIEADARVRIAQIQADTQRERSLLDQQQPPPLPRVPSYDPTRDTPAPAPTASFSAGDLVIPAVLLMLLRGGL